MNGPAYLSENSILELELTPSTTSPKERGVCELRQVSCPAGVLSKLSANLVDLHVKEKRDADPT